MLNNKAIASRFFACFHTKSKAELARYLEVSWATVKQWETAKRPVPWKKLRYLVLTQTISWDWLLEGTGPKHWHVSQPRGDDFDKEGINRRFLQCFSGRRKTEIAKEIGVTHSAVSSWFANRRQVPWEKLGYLVAAGRSTWEWLIDGAGEAVYHDDASLP